MMMRNFDKKSVFLMVFLVLITGGIYIPIYFINIKKITNNLKISKKIPNFLLYFFLVLSIVQVIVMLLSFQYSILNQIGEIINFGYLILTLFLAFRLKDILNDYFNNLVKVRVTYDSVLTFFFTIFYLQYKINKAAA